MVVVDLVVVDLVVVAVEGCDGGCGRRWWWWWFVVVDKYTTCKRLLVEYFKKNKTKNIPDASRVPVDTPCRRHRHRRHPSVIRVVVDDGGRGPGGGCS